MFAKMQDRLEGRVLGNDVLIATSSNTTADSLSSSEHMPCIFKFLKTSLFMFIMCFHLIDYIHIVSKDPLLSKFYDECKT